MLMGIICVLGSNTIYGDTKTRKIIRHFRSLILSLFNIDLSLRVM